MVHRTHNYAPPAYGCAMVNELIPCRVEAHLTGTPPAARLAQTPGVTDLASQGFVVTCTVTGSMQPFLECLRGYEVTRLISRALEPGETEPGQDVDHRA